MSLTVERSSHYSPSVTRFTYKGEDVDLWVKAVNRIIDANEVLDDRYKWVVHTDSRTGYVKSLGPFKQFIRHPENAVMVERIVRHALAGEFDKIQLTFTDGYFKGSLKTLWNTLKHFPEFRVDKRVLELLKMCGAVTSDFILCELLKFMSVTFKGVKDALRRLEKLYLVEYHAGYWSYRHHILR